MANLNICGSFDARKNIIYIYIYYLKQSWNIFQHPQMVGECQNNSDFYTQIYKRCMKQGHNNFNVVHKGAVNNLDNDT